ncbi:MAG: prepilin-type N-terminal cleavage/methylation domain-containing protein [Acidimicrobiia bacterium]|nr:prepilin-type N-terminal cleavage/methylation domain-containing protein [Acidimicrobiia bacterium]
MKSAASRARSADARGFTILEMVMALSLFGIIMLGIATTVDSGLNLTRNNRNRSVAANLAAQEMDLVRTSNFVTLAPASTVQEVGDVPYTVNRELTWVPKSASNGPCDGSGGSPQLLRVRVSVTWPSMRGVTPVVSDSAMTPPVGAYDPNTGHIAVKVLDRDAAPSFGSSVTATGPETRTLPTNSDGCAFFAYLTPGTYTVSLNTTGYVDRQGSPVPNQVVGVSVGVTSSAQFDYDQSSSLALTLVPDAGGVVPADIPVTLGNTIFLPVGTKLVPGSGDNRTLSDLFPAADGYEAWTGGCADADPQGERPGGEGPYWPGALRTAPFAMTPGGTETGSVTLRSIEIEVDDGFGAPVTGATVVATHDADEVCASGATHTLGVTDLDGELTAGLPYGAWELSVNGRTALPQWPTVALDPTESTTPAAQVVVE